MAVARTNHWLLSTRAPDRRRMVEMLYHVVLAVATAADYSKSQTNNIGWNTSINVLISSPKRCCTFLIYDSFGWQPSSLNFSSPFHPLSLSLIKSTVYSVPTFLHFSIQHLPHRHSSVYSTRHFYLSLLCMTSGSSTFLMWDTTKQFIYIFSYSPCVHSLQDSRLEVDRQFGGSEF